MIEQNTLPLAEDRMTEQNCARSLEDKQTFADIIRAEVHQALRTLSPQERRAVSLSYGIDCYAEGSYHEIGQVMGVSCYSVRYLIFSALLKLSHEPNLQMLVGDIPATLDWYGDEDSYGVARKEQYL
jgi:RNA polymerase sigma factor (sigma-70 family)